MLPEIVKDPTQVGFVVLNRWAQYQDIVKIQGCNGIQLTMNICFMSLWNIEGALQRPKMRTKYLKSPQ